MIGPPAISKMQPRGRPFAKGQSGNPGGRPKRTDEEVALIESCRQKTPEALGVIVDLMEQSSNDRVRLAAAQFIIERGYGRAPERVELVAKHEEGPLPGSELTPREAYFRLVRGEVDFVDVDVPALPLIEGSATGLGAILTEMDSEPCKP